jgi:hypothetical protein
MSKRTSALPEFVCGKPLFVKKVTERDAQEALNAQLAKSHRETLELLSTEVDALAELDALMSGAKPSFTGGKMKRYSTLLQTASALDNAAFNVESALLTNDYTAWADYSDVEPVNIPKQFARGIVPQPQSQSRRVDGNDRPDFRISCGF